MARLLPPVPPPVFVNVESTLGCNLACRMCGSHLSGVTKQHRTMSSELLEKVEREVLPGAVDMALTVAGEPFMTPRLATFVELAERTGAQLQMNTNATLIKDSALLRRILARSSVIKFSVDGADKARYESIRHEADFDVVTANIRTVVRVRAELPRARRPRLALCMVLMRSNVDQLAQMVDLAHDLGLDRLEVAHMTVLAPHLEEEALRHHPDLADHHVRRARARADALGFPASLPPLMSGQRLVSGPRARLRVAARDLASVSTTRVKRLARSLERKARIGAWSARAGGRVPCHFLQSGVYVTIGGLVAPCPMPGRPVAGDLRTQTFAEIWNGPVLTAMRRGFLDGRPFDCCAHCSQNPEVYAPADEATARPPDYHLTLRQDGLAVDGVAGLGDGGH